jgi:hypothetical protein
MSLVPYGSHRFSMGIPSNQFFVVHLIRIPTCLGTRRWFCFHTRCFVYFGGLSCNHPTSGSLLDRAVVTPAWARIYSSGSPETCRIITDAICRNSKNRIRLKLCRPFLGSFKARAPPWWNSPIMHSCVSPSQIAPINNLPVVKLPSTCQNALALLIISCPSQ